MKVKVKETEKKFEPIKLTITIESEEELCNLWHRLNIASYSIENDEYYVSKRRLKYFVNGDCYVLWSKLDMIIDKCNLKK